MIIILIHANCGGEMKEVRYPPDPDGDEPVGGKHEVTYVCIKCGAKMDSNSVQMVKRMEMEENAHSN